MTFPAWQQDVVALKEDVAGLIPGDAFWSKTASWLVNTFITAEADEYHTSGGTPKVKTRKQTEIDRAGFEALAKLVADHPLYPLGNTQTSVLLGLRERLDDITTTRQEAANA